jgi:glycosyltransferase involved in cell wall biosynthesis
VKGSLIGDYGVAPERVEVLPPGVDVFTWRPGPRRTDGRLRVLFVGGDFYRKGGEAVLAAFHRLPPASTELMLVTRTAVPPSEGVFVFPDMQPNSAELIALYQSCDVFVLPSHAEAFGIAAVEASAVGLPVVATAVGGLTDIVADGETGFLIQPGDAETLARHLRRLAEDAGLRTRLGQAARQRAEARFDARTNARRLGALLCQASEPA